MLEDYLTPESIRRRGLYDPGFVQQTLREEREGRADHAHLLWRLLCNELWFRTFFP
jgi:asparagine synthase (glutamine-hydrolysing)